MCSGVFKELSVGATVAHEDVLELEFISSSTALTIRGLRRIPT